MKIAVLITAYANFNHLKKLVAALDHENIEIYIHIDKKFQLPENIIEGENIHYIPRIKVWWGGYSHLQAIINLVKAAKAKNPDYFVLISGGDYPVKPMEYLFKVLNDGGEYMEISRGFSKAKPEARIKNFYFDAFDRRDKKSFKTKFYFLAEKIIRQLYKKKRYPFKEVYHGSTWWALSAKCVDFILNFMDKNPEFVNFYKSSWCPEEAMFHTIIGNSEFYQNVKHDLTYADWSVKPGPGKITMEHVRMFEKNKNINGGKGGSHTFFARKFDDASSEIVDYIDENLRK